jgi:putative ABC transport system ATP-binding protein
VGELIVCTRQHSYHEISVSRFTRLSADDSEGIELSEGVAEGHEDEPIVKLNNVHKTYLLGVEGVAALRGVTLSVPRGQFVIILGTSGGGKTSLLNLIGTIDTPTKGSVSVCGLTISEKTDDSQLAAIRLHKIGFVFQAFNLLQSMTAVENVEVPMVLAAAGSAATRRERAKTLLDSVGLAGRYDHKPSQLSGGEQQRVTIARAVSNSPRLLLLDEPTGDLDSRSSEMVLEILLGLNEQQGMTLVMVTHDIGLKHLAHRVVHMRDGKVHRDEAIAPEVRAEARASLAEAVARHEVVHVEGEEEEATRAQGLPPPRTTRRAPGHYRMNRG